MARIGKPARAVVVPAPKPVKSLLKIVDVEQGQPEWFQARLGLVTASHFSTILASGRDGGDSMTRAHLAEARWQIKQMLEPK